MSQERLKVLELLASGKINADQAAGLLRNLSAAPPPPPTPKVNPVDDSAETSPPDKAEEADNTVEFTKELGDLKAQVRVAAQSASADADPAKRVRIRIEEDGGKSAESSTSDDTPLNEPTRLRIRVTDDNGKQRVNIGIPFKLLQFGVNIGERFAPELGEWDWQKLDIDIEDGEGHVRIFVE